MDRNRCFSELRRFKEEFLNAHSLNLMKATALVCIMLAIIGHLLFSFEFLQHGIAFGHHEGNSTSSRTVLSTRILFIGWCVFDVTGSVAILFVFASLCPRNGGWLTERFQTVYLFVLSAYILFAFVMYSYSICYVSNHKAMPVSVFKSSAPLLAVLWVFFVVDTVLNVLLEGLVGLHLYTHRPYKVVVPPAYENKSTATVDEELSASSPLLHANA